MIFEDGWCKILALEFLKKKKKTVALVGTGAAAAWEASDGQGNDTGRILHAAAKGHPAGPRPRAVTESNPRRFACLTLCRSIAAFLRLPSLSRF